jgi:hypothetical protein
MEYEHEIVDYFGSPVNIGDHGVRVDIGRPYHPFKKFVVVKIDKTRRHDPIGIHVEMRYNYNNRKPRTTWVDKDKIITQGSLRISLQNIEDPKVNSMDELI